MKFCSACGGTVEVRMPDDGDHLPRHICLSCRVVHYINPKIIVGVIPEAPDGQVLMCRRNIEPRLGKWTFPAGFMELGETCAVGAAREALEESLAEVEVTGLLSVLSVPGVNQVHITYRGRLRGGQYGSTHESSEVRLMSELDIPWTEIAFPTIFHSLRCYFSDRAKGVSDIHTADITRDNWREIIPTGIFD